MEATTCSKCKTKGKHTPRNCKEPWPKWEDQVCDRCLGTHANKMCKLSTPHMSCTICGHDGAHNAIGCPIDNKPENLNHVIQWTKEKFEEYQMNKAKQEAKKAKKAGNTGNASGPGPSTPAGGSNTTFVPKPNQIGKPPRPRPYVQPKADPTDVRETNPDKAPELNIRPCDHEEATLDPDRQEKRDWAQQTFEAVPFKVHPARNLGITANFFKMNFGSHCTFYKYKMLLGTERGKPVKKVEVKKALLWKLLHTQRPPKSANFVSDYVSCVYSVGPLYEEFDHNTSTSWEVPHRLTPIPGETPKIMITKFTFEGRFDSAEILQYVKAQKENRTGFSPDYLADQDARALNVVTWKNISNDGVFSGGTNGKKFYPDPFSTAKNLPKTGQPIFVLCNGFFSSVRPCVAGPLLNVNPTTTAFFAATNLQKWIGAQGGNLGGAPSVATQVMLSGLRVTFDCDRVDSKDKRKRRIISEFPGALDKQWFKMNPTDTTYLNVHTYLEATYKDFRFSKSACAVNCGSKDVPRYYPAEFLTIAEWQPVKGTIDHKFSEEMLKDAKRDPEQNKSAIMWKAMDPLGLVRPNGVARTGLGVPQAKGNIPYELSFHSNFGFQIEGQLLKIKARMMPNPTLLFGGSGRLALAGENKGFQGSWQLKARRVLQPGNNSPRIAFVALGYGPDCYERPGIEYFIARFLPRLQAAGYTGAVALDPEYVEAFLGSKDNSVVRTEVQRRLDPCRERLSSSDLVFIIIKEHSKTIYPHLKWWSDCSVGLPMICLTFPVSQKWTKQNSEVPDLSMAENLILKVNLKLGGTLHNIDGIKTGWGTKAHTMIVGADVTHPGRSQECPSMAGVVATRDAVNPHFLASARLQDGKQEFIETLDEMIQERLLVYHAKSGRLPDHILFYRDGVSDSQYGMVSLREIPLIRQGCSDAGVALFGKGKAYKPSITLLVVGKRHHVRFYPTEAPKLNQTTGKPLPQDKNFQSGLIVDTDVTSPSKCDFYLQSHDCPIGTARSAHYVILLNESGYNMEELQDLTHKLCFMGSRATKALSICTPAKYADILCDRLRCYMKRCLDKKIRKQDPPGPDLNGFKAAVDTWGAQLATSPKRMNPWHPRLDEFMFYL